VRVAVLNGVNLDVLGRRDPAVYGGISASELETRIYEWASGRILHAKTAVVDGTWATVGSSNLDPMSLRQNLEVNAQRPLGYLALGKVLLAMSTNAWLRERATKTAFVRRSVSTFMPGERLEDAMTAAAAQDARGIGTIFTKLGENLTRVEDAEDVTLFCGDNETPDADRALARWEDEIGRAIPSGHRPSRDIAIRLALVYEFAQRSKVFISTLPG